MKKEDIQRYLVSAIEKKVKAAKDQNYTMASQWRDREKELLEEFVNKSLKEIVITDFYLMYDGMFYIDWDGRRTRVYLELNTILRMLEIEGLTSNDINKSFLSMKHFQKHIHFKKAKMMLRGELQNRELFLLLNEYSYDNIDELTMFHISLIEPEQDKE